LDLFGTDITGDGLKHLTKLKNLESLILGFCPIGDGAVEHLLSPSASKPATSERPQNQPAV
jgi:hypothetical protein